MEQLVIHPVVESLLQYILEANQKPAWLAFRVLRYTHCGKGITKGVMRPQGCLHCKCDFCFRAPEIVSADVDQANGMSHNEVRSSKIVPTEEPMRWKALGRKGYLCRYTILVVCGQDAFAKNSHW